MTQPRDEAPEMVAELEKAWLDARAAVSAACNGDDGWGGHILELAVDECRAAYEAYQAAIRTRAP